MAKKKRKKKRETTEQLLDEVDRFLEGGTDALSPAVRRQLDEEKETAPPPDSSSDTPPPPEVASALAEIEAEAAAPSELELVLIEDGLKAVVRTVYPDTSATDILSLLERNEITCGVDKAAILKAVETARQADQHLTDVIVAQGKPPQPPSTSRIEYRPPKGLDALPSLDPVRQLLALCEREEIAQAALELQAWAVKPGDLLAVRIVSEGKEGVDVEGQPIPIPEEAIEKQVDPRLQPGPGVQLAPNGTDYIACTCGYAGLENSKVTVIDPLWISPDGMDACYLRLPLLTGSQSPQPDDLRALLEAFNVASGIDEEALDRFSKNFTDQQALLVTLARGEPPRPPKDALPAFPLDYEFRVGTFRPDGSIDFRERNIFPTVHQDDLLVECRVPVPGQPGHTVLGQEIPVDDPVKIQLTPGENVRIEREGEIQRLYATADGGAVLKTQEQRSQSGTVQTREYAVQIQPVARIEGDVCYETGNVDFQGNVEIGGSVQGGFHVHATGDVVVANSLEAGSEIQTDGDVVVQQGIVGRETIVRVKGSVSAKFVHDATIQAGADVLLGSYARGAQLRASGRVQVEGLGGSGNSGGIIGGRTWGVKGIVSRNLGSERSTTTNLFVGLEPDQHARSEKLSRSVRQAELMLEKLLKAIDLPTLKADEIRKLVASNPAKKATVLHYVKKANQLAQVREKFLAEQRALEEQIAEAAREARVDVPDQAFARTAIHIGSLQLVLVENLQKVRFLVDPEQPKIVWQDLT